MSVERHCRGTAALKHSVDRQKLENQAARPFLEEPIGPRASAPPQ